MATIAALDVDYRSDGAVAACVGFDAWSDAQPALELVHRSSERATDYEPGSFSLRELPYLLELLLELPGRPETVIVDGHVWLAGDDRGLGAHLHDALGGDVAVVGVAKGPFRGATRASTVLRGKSAQPLYVTAIGTDAAVAANSVRAMHGAHRIPTLLKRVDRLCRDSR